MVRNCHNSPRNDREDRGAQIFRGGSLKSRVILNAMNTVFTIK